VSHITIIISSKGTGGGVLTATESTDEMQITYTPPDDLNSKQIGKEVAKRIRWLDTLAHADASDT
jgi:hypothetical protein